LEGLAQRKTENKEKLQNNKELFQYGHLEETIRVYKEVETQETQDIQDTQDTGTHIQIRLEQRKK